MERRLIELLGQTDALWLPFRQRHWQRQSASTVYYERRTLFGVGGLPWRVGGTVAERVRGLRVLAQLRKAGSVRIQYRKGEAFPLVRLVDDADDELRLLCGLAPFAESLKLLDELHRRQGDEPARWIPEEQLAGIAWGDPRQGDVLGTQAVDFSPCLARGLVESNSSVLGHAWFRLSELGHRLAAERVANGTAAHGQRPEPSPPDWDARWLYVDARNTAECEMLDAQPVDHREIGYIPLPCSFEGVG